MKRGRFFIAVIVLITGVVAGCSGTNVSAIQPTPVAYPQDGIVIHESKNPKALTIVMVGDQFNDQVDFEIDARIMSFAIISETVFAKRKDDINIRSEKLQPGSSLNMYFGCQGIDRLLCVDEKAAIERAKRANQGNEPDQVIALLNSDKHGGAGGRISTVSSKGSASRLVVVHELGHSICGLPDEYGPDGKPDPAKGNSIMNTLQGDVHFTPEAQATCGAAISKAIG